MLHRRLTTGENINREIPVSVYFSFRENFFWPIAVEIDRVAVTPGIARLMMIYWGARAGRFDSESQSSLERADFALPGRGQLSKSDRDHLGTTRAITVKSSRSILDGE